MVCISSHLLVPGAQLSQNVQSSNSVGGDTILGSNCFYLTVDEEEMGVRRDGEHFLSYD